MDHQNEVRAETPMDEFGNMTGFVRNVHIMEAGTPLVTSLVFNLDPQGGGEGKKFVAYSSTTAGALLASATALVCAAYINKSVIRVEYYLSPDLIPNPEEPGVKIPVNRVRVVELPLE